MAAGHSTLTKDEVFELAVLHAEMKCVEKFSDVEAEVAEKRRKPYLKNHQKQILRQYKANHRNFLPYTALTEFDADIFPSPYEAGGRIMQFEAALLKCPKETLLNISADSQSDYSYAVYVTPELSRKTLNEFETSLAIVINKLDSNNLISYENKDEPLAYSVNALIRHFALSRSLPEENINRSLAGDLTIPLATTRILPTEATASDAKFIVEEPIAPMPIVVVPTPSNIKTVRGSNNLFKPQLEAVPEARSENSAETSSLLRDFTRKEKPAASVPNYGATTPHSGPVIASVQLKSNTVITVTPRKNPWWDPCGVFRCAYIKNATKADEESHLLPKP